MTSPISVLILSQDPTVFSASGVVTSDTRRRHIRYADILQDKCPGSDIRVLTLTRRGTDTARDQPSACLQLFGTQSAHRLMFLIDMWRVLRGFQREGWRPGVITAQTPWEEALVGLAFAKRWRVPFVSQFHSDFYGSGFRRERWIHEILYRVSRWMARKSDHIRVVSSGIRSAIVSHGDARGETVSVIPVPVDYSFCEVQAIASEPLPDMVLFVGRLVAVKDLHLWLDTAAEIFRARSNVRFVIAGDGPERESLESRARVMGLEVNFLGAVDHRDLPRLYSQASVFLLTSVYEGLGRVLLEAMLSSVPVVSVDIVGPRDLITDQMSGRLVTGRSAGALSTAVIELLTDRKKALAIAVEAKKRALETFAFEAVASQLADMWVRVAVFGK